MMQDEELLKSQVMNIKDAIVRKEDSIKRLEKCIKVGKQEGITEVELLPFSAILMTYECGIRFLSDYLNGDTYFKIHREHHNLDRARNQFKLVKDMLAKKNEAEAIVKKYL